MDITRHIPLNSSGIPALLTLVWSDHFHLLRRSRPIGRQTRGYDPLRNKPCMYVCFVLCCVCVFLKVSWFDMKHIDGAKTLLQHLVACCCVHPRVTTRVTPRVCPRVCARAIGVVIWFGLVWIHFGIVSTWFDLF